MTTIEWTHRPGTKGETWNPVRGCSLVSQGCKNCYAMKFAHRFSGPGKPYEGLTHKTNSGVKWTGKIKLAEDMLSLPLHWKHPRTVFVNSMSDLAHEAIPFEYIDRCFDTMDACQQHTFLILTKRALRLLEYFVWKDAGNGFKFDNWPLKNVWIGVSVEDQATADERIPVLLQIPAAIRFLSCEPLLGAIDLTHLDADRAGHKEYCQVNALTGRHTDMARPCADVNKIDWVIVGGESSHDSRPIDPDWARSLRDQCKASGVAFFFKQWGEWMPLDNRPAGEFNIAKCYDIGTFKKSCIMYRTGKTNSGNLLDGKQHLEFPKTLTPA